MDAANTVNAAGAQTQEERQALGEVARWWWAWLVAGILWILASVFILQFRQGSLSLVGIIIGAMFLIAGLQDFLIAAVSPGWKWLWITFGVILVLGGIYALFNPVGTILAVANLLGFLFAIIGIFWIIEAFATRSGNDLWWLGLIAGIIMVGLGFWAADQFLSVQVYTLLIFAGVWALLHGVTDIVKAFTIRKLGASVVA
jgi:uncharacterized membrane protein HdeD (DUF308 family)